MCKKLAVLAVMAVLFVSTCGAVYANINTPAAHWKFDESSGTIANDSAGGNNGTVINGTWAAGKIGGALNFSSGYVNCGEGANLNITGTITLSGWVKTTMTTESGIVAKWDASVTNGDGLQTSYYLLINHFTSGPAEFHLRGSNAGSSSCVISTTSVNDGMWHLVTGVYDGSYMKMYIDGQFETSIAYSGGIYSGAPKENVFIGNSDEGAERVPFTGAIDDVRIYDYALSANEVAQLYTIPEPATMILLCAGVVLFKRK